MILPLWLFGTAAPHTCRRLRPRTGTTCHPSRVSTEALESRILLAAAHELNGSPLPGVEHDQIATSAVQIIDNGDVRFSTTGGWTRVPNANFPVPNGHAGDIHHAAAGSGSAVATWAFDGLIPGTYRVSATWSTHQNRATNAPYTVRDRFGGVVLESSIVNQELEPSDLTTAGSNWQDIGVVTITGGTLVVELTNAANQYVIADAVRIEQSTALLRDITVIDDGEVGFATTAGWNKSYLAEGYQDDIRTNFSGSGSEIASWTFDGLRPGSYLVSATWSAHANRATDAPYTLIDGIGGDALETVPVNQKLSPDDFHDRGTTWENLGIVWITGSSLVVELSDAANQYVIADAIRIVPIDAARPPTSQIIDNGGPGFSTAGAWTQSPILEGRDGDIRHSTRGDGSNIAIWTFTGLTPGEYRVAATWSTHANRATDAPYTIRDGAGGPILGTVDINQEQTPEDFAVAGSGWQDLMTVTITGAELVVELSNDADQYVIADAIRIESLNNIDERRDKLRDVVLGLHVYHDSFVRFPTDRVPELMNENGQPVLSWRVHLLPHIGYGELYRQFRLDEPWDSPHNLALLDQMPDEFRSRGLPEGTNLSGYRMFEGRGAYEYDADGGNGIRDAADGVQQTLQLIETMPEDAAFWTRPEGIPFNPADPLGGLTLPPDFFLAATVDGTIREVNPAVAPENFAATVTWDGGEVLTSEQFADIYLDWAAEDGRDTSLEKLKAIAVAFHNFHDTSLHFPPGDNVPPEWFNPETGLPYLSWRVHLLPFLGYSDLYQQFHVDEPWDSPNNFPLLNKMPEAFRSRGLAPGGTTTGFKILSGAEAYNVTYLPGGSHSEGPNFYDIPDGLSTTILMIELAPDQAVPWTQWNEIDYSPDNPLEGIGFVPDDGLRVLMWDGATRTLSPTATPEDFAIFATTNQNEIFGPAESSNVFFDWQLVDSRTNRRNKLWQIGLAMHNYADIYRHFPISWVAEWWDEAAQLPKLSWRVHLLPQLGYGDLFEQFHLDEPWNSPHNIQLLDKMPEEFRSRGLPADSNRTAFKLFVGDDAYDYRTDSPDPSDWQGPRYSDITDGTSNTIAVIELLADRAVEWTRPDGDIMFDPADPLAGVGEIPTDGLLALMFDGSIRTVSPTVTPENFATFVTTDSGEIFGPAETTNAFIDWQRPALEGVHFALRAADATTRKNHLKWVGWALHSYHDIHATFPVSGSPTFINPETNRPFLSWRVHLLPFLDHDDLYKQFHLDEPWDSPHNIQLLDKMPEVYRSRGLAPDSTKTGLQLFFGEGAWTSRPYDRTNGTYGPRTRDIRDGTSRTIAVIETLPEDAVEWTRPDGDIAWDSADPYGGLTKPDDFFLALLFDGSVGTFHPWLNEDEFRGWVTFAGGEVPVYDP